MRIVRIDNRLNRLGRSKAPTKSLIFEMYCRLEATIEQIFSVSDGVGAFRPNSIRSLKLVRIDQGVDDCPSILCADLRTVIEQINCGEYLIVFNKEVGQRHAFVISLWLSCAYRRLDLPIVTAPCKIAHGREECWITHGGAPHFAECFVEHASSQEDVPQLPPWL